MFRGAFKHACLIDLAGWRRGRFGVILCVSSAWFMRAFELPARLRPGVTGAIAGTMRILGAA